MSDSKNSRWAFTAYEEQWPLLDDIDPSFVKYVKWQDEVCPDTGRKHKQGAMLTQAPQRFSAMRKRFPGMHLEPAKNWQALLAYCEKSETRDVSGSRHETTYPSTRPPRVDELLDMMADLLAQDEAEENMLPASCRSSINPLEEEAKAQYWQLARRLLQSKPILASILGQPLPQNLWANTREVWIERARERTHATEPEDGGQ